jgi:hypothetical protein
MEDKIVHIINETIFNMLDATIFYIPEALVDLYNPEEKENLNPFINKLILVDDGDFKIINSDDKAAIIVMRKINLLSEGLFMLYNLKDKLGEEGFKYIVEKYGELLELFHFSTKWLNSNFEKDIVGFSEDHKKAFLMQYQMYVGHKQEYEKRFKLPKVEISQNNSIAVSLLNNFKDFVPPLDAKILNDNTKKTKGSVIERKRLEKKEHIKQLNKETLENAENYLLSTVFNVVLEE